MNAEVQYLRETVKRLRELVREQNQLARENADLRDKLDSGALAQALAEDRVGELTTERDHLSVKYSDLVSAVDPVTYPSPLDVPHDTISAAEQRRLLDLATSRSKFD